MLHVQLVHLAPFGLVRQQRDLFPNMFKCSPAGRKVGSRRAANGNVLPPTVLGSTKPRSGGVDGVVLRASVSNRFGPWLLPFVSFLFDVLLGGNAICFTLMWYSSKGSNRVVLVWLGCQSCIEAPGFYLPTRPAYSAAEFTSQVVKIRWGNLCLEKLNRSKIQDDPSTVAVFFWICSVSQYVHYCLQLPLVARVSACCCSKVPKCANAAVALAR